MKFLIAALLVFSVFALMCTKSTEPENSAPYEPGNPTPSNGATGQPLNVVLLWSGGDPDSDPVCYDVYFGPNSSPPLISSNQTGRNYTPSALGYSTDYYWRIVAEDDHDHSTEGSIWSFTTGNTPVTPSNLALRSDAEGDGVVITWDMMSNIDSLILVPPDSAVVTLNADDTIYTDDTPLQTGSYALYAIHAGNLSAPATVSSSAFASISDVTLDALQGPGGYGWDITSGEGEALPLNSGNTSIIDFYLPEDTLTLYLRSCDQPPFNGNKRTDIQNMGTSSFFTAPLAGYTSEELAVVGDYYAMRVEGDYYAKVYVVDSDSTTITFRYWFQTLQSLRIF
jgi:hypothetical protein